ncbi:MAG: ComEC/Rec2 family competence protein [Oscillospiraceae bacterium]|nr:ComEC/Rec2 family competence protein [Oscillospiraceae bacterium]
MSRRLAVILGVFLAAVFFISAAGFVAVPFILAVLAAAAGFVFLKYKNKFFIVVFFAGVLAVLFCAAYFNFTENPVLKYAGTTAQIKAEIKKVQPGLFFTRFELRVFETGGTKLGRFGRFDIDLTVYDIIEAEIGDIFEGYVTFGTLGGEDKNYYRAQGIFIAAEEARDEDFEEQPRIISTGSRGFNYHIDRLQIHVREVFFKYIKQSYHDKTTQEAALVYGVFTGVKEHIEARTKNDFKRAGVSHVLSVSGLHLSILAGICAFVLKLFNVNKKISSISVIIFSLLFAGFAGFTMSAMRASIMIILFYTAFLLERKSDAVTSLVIAGFLIVLPNPYHSLNIGFQLSFCATFGIVFTQEQVSEIIKKIRFKALKIIVSSVFITLAAVIFTLPVTAYNFKAVSLVSVISNLAAGPVIPFILFFALMLSLFSFFKITIILEFFGWLLYHCVRIFISIIKFISSFEYAYISTASTVNTYFHVFSVLFLAAFILLIIFFKRNKYRKLLCISVSLTFVLLFASQIYPRVLFSDTVRFAYYSDYRNQNIILFSQNYNSADIIDITHGSSAPVYGSYNIMTSNGAVNVDSIILTHYHRQHPGMIGRYADYSNINTVYAPEILNDYDTEVYSALSLLSQRLGFELINYGNMLKTGDVYIARGVFEYDKMLHFWIDLNYGHVNLLYSGIGYESGYRAYKPELFDVDYDIIFYGSHKHNYRDDDYISGFFAGGAGVLSQYMTRGTKQEDSTRFERGILAGYLEQSNLYYAAQQNSHSHMVFAAEKNGNISKYLMK